jgi:hypothetical protein
MRRVPQRHKSYDMTTPIDGQRDQLALADRVHTALDARRSGKTWAQAAELAGYSNRGACWNAVMGYISRQVTDNVIQLRQEANERTARRLLALEDMALDDELPADVRLRAHAELTRLEARHARLNGTDAPVQVALTAGVAAELSDMLAEAEAVLVRGEVLPQREDEGQAPPALEA